MLAIQHTFLVFLQKDKAVKTCYILGPLEKDNLTKPYFEHLWTHFSHRHILVHQPPGGFFQAFPDGFVSEQAVADLALHQPSGHWDRHQWKNRPQWATAIRTFSVLGQKKMETKIIHGKHGEPQVSFCEFHFVKFGGVYLAYTGS